MIALAEHAPGGDPRVPEDVDLRVGGGSTETRPGDILTALSQRLWLAQQSYPDLVGPIGEVGLRSRRTTPHRRRRPVPRGRPA
ncbi:MAG TPA: hypothetical protein VF516_02610 [Kofleriaceae bacterium]